LLLAIQHASVEQCRDSTEVLPMTTDSNSHRLASYAFDAVTAVKTHGRFAEVVISCLGMHHTQDHDDISYDNHPGVRFFGDLEIRQGCIRMHCIHLPSSALWLLAVVEHSNRLNSHSDPRTHGLIRGTMLTSFQHQFWVSRSHPFPTAYSCPSYHQRSLRETQPIYVAYARPIQLHAI
jgi:hypothetical protein